MLIVIGLSLGVGLLYCVVLYFQQEYKLELIRENDFNTVVELAKQGKYDEAEAIMLNYVDDPTFISTGNFAIKHYQSIKIEMPR